mgnify:FL=1
MAGLADLTNRGSMFNGINDSNSMFGSSSGYNGVDSMYGDIANTNVPTPSTSSSGFGFNTGTLGVVTGGLQGLSGLAQAFVGMKNYELAQQQFKYQKGLANRNLANQAKIINNTYDNAAQVAAGMIGGKDVSGNYGFTNQAIVDDYAKKAKEKHVDGSAI